MVYSPVPQMLVHCLGTQQPRLSFWNEDFLKLEKIPLKKLQVIVEMKMLCDAKAGPERSTRRLCSDSWL